VETPDFALIYITCPNEEEAVRIARLVLERRLAACANIVPRVRSLYWWNGQLQDEGECLLLLKAPYSYYDEVEKLVRTHHPYQVPAIVRLPLTAGLEEYFRWMAAETGFDY